MAAPRPDRSGPGVGAGATPTGDGRALPFSAAVLCGGSSTRLGVDKAALEVGGVPLAVLVGRIARGAGAAPVAGVGARPPVVAALVADHMEVLDDRWPGEGPAAGVATVLGATSSPLLVVLGCDYPLLQPATVGRLVARLTAEVSAGAVVAHAEGRVHPTVGVWRVAACLGPAADYLARGGRSLVGLADAVGAVPEPVAADELHDLDTPGDLAVLAARLAGPRHRAVPGTLGETPATGAGTTTTR